MYSSKQTEDCRRSWIYAIFSPYPSPLSQVIEKEALGVRAIACSLYIKKPVPEGTDFYVHHQ